MPSTPKLVFRVNEAGDILAWGYDTEIDDGIPAPVSLPLDFGNTFGDGKYTFDAQSAVVVADPEYLPAPLEIPAILQPVIVAEPEPVAVDPLADVAQPTPLAPNSGGIVVDAEESVAFVEAQQAAIEEAKPDVKLEEKPAPVVAEVAMVAADAIVETVAPETP